MSVDTRRPLIGISCDLAGDNGEDAAARRRQRYVVPRLYVESVVEAGGAPVILPCAPDQALLRDVCAPLSGVLLMGGRDYPAAWYGEAAHPATVPLHPLRAASDRLLARLAIESGRPVLGICGGMQLLTLVLGGALVQHIASEIRHTALSDTEDAEHAVTVEPGSRLAEILGPGPHRVNSSHHQCADPTRLGRGLRVTARAPDGIVEAIEPAESGERFLLGVQWHPERMSDASHRAQLLRAFLAACRRVG